MLSACLFLTGWAEREVTLRDIIIALVLCGPREGEGADFFSLLITYLISFTKIYYSLGSLVMVMRADLMIMVGNMHMHALHCTHSHKLKGEIMCF